MDFLCGFLHCQHPHDRGRSSLLYHIYGRTWNGRILWFNYASLYLGCQSGMVCTWLSCRFHRSSNVDSIMHVVGFGILGYEEE
uniref:Uncharacterized protein n=1 Tax=uncultured marine thaumarchaeote KM3_115_A11 TaxID=1455988 RepID=A0A075G6K6_9ARCH|nr:hypothetical protein [uncultured marine thaumarchaeote KM3_115_A11]